MAYGKVMFIGESGAGKTSLLRALMNLPIVKANSTVMADIWSLKWRKAATTEDGYWNEVSEEDELRELAILANQVMRSESASGLSAATDTPTPTLESPQPGDIDDNLLKQANKELSEIIAKSKVYSSTERIESDQYLNVWDSGGQRVFLDVLPPFLTMRTMFCLMFDASKPLSEKVEVNWNKEGQSTHLETLKITREDLILQWMHCIHSTFLNRSDINVQILGQDSQVSRFPQILVIGTHRDEIKGIHKRGIKGKLRRRYPCHDQVKGTLILDTMKRDDKEDPGIKKVMELVKLFVSDALCISTPVAWVLFRKVFIKITTKQNSPVVEMDKVAIISQSCGIENSSLNSVLSFYHDLGVFLHYASVEGLKDVVIAQPQWLVKLLGTLLAPELPGEKIDGPKEAWKLLRHQGILVQALYEEVWKGKNVRPQALVNLLESLSLISKIKKEAIAIPPASLKYDGANMYFMPGVLPISTKEVEPDVHAVLTAAPLHLVFSTKYVPPGYFVRLVTVLSSKNDNIWMMFTDEMVSNMIVFQYQVDKSYGRMDSFTLFGAASSIRIDMNRKAHCAYNSNWANFPCTCQALLKLLYGAIHEVQQWFPSVKVEPAFQCKCSPKEPHFVTISLTHESSTVLPCEYQQVLSPSADEQLWLRIPQSKVSCHSELKK